MPWQHDAPCQQPCLPVGFHTTRSRIVQATFGELCAFLTLGGLLLEYVLGMAAVARGFSRQFARLCNQDPQQFVSGRLGGGPGEA